MNILVCENFTVLLRDESTTDAFMATFCNFKRNFFPNLVNNYF